MGGQGDEVSVRCLNGERHRERQGSGDGKGAWTPVAMTVPAVGRRSRRSDR